MKVNQSEFGTTGHGSSRVIFGAAGLGECSQEFADRVLEILLAHGVNHIDTAASYGDSELRIAPWMSTRRREFFLATKTEERSGEGARAGLERSLARLGVDHVDLIQMHNLVEEEEWREAHGPGGALEALVQARDDGLVRFIGVTGHGVRIPRMHLRSLERFPYDSVLFPYNFAMVSDATYRRDADALIEHCMERGVAIQTIKSVARRRWLQGGPDMMPHHSWYEPLKDADAISRAVAFVLGRSELFLNSSSDYSVLEQTLTLAEEGTVLPETSEMDADVASLGIERLFDGAALEVI